MSYWDGALVGLGGILAALALYGFTWPPIRKLICRYQIRQLRKRVDADENQEVWLLRLIAQELDAYFDTYVAIRDLPEYRERIK